MVSVLCLAEFLECLNGFSSHRIVRDRLSFVSPHFCASVFFGPAQHAHASVFFFARISDHG